MNKRYAISTGTNTLQSVNKNTFSPIGDSTSAFSFTPRKSGHVTPTNDEYISLERRRTYQYYEKK
mgnify:CR=1 FL=1